MKKNVKTKKRSTPRKTKASAFGINGVHALTDGYEALLKSNTLKKFKKNISREDIAHGLLGAGVAAIALIMLLKARKPKNNGMIQAFKEHLQDAYEGAAENIKDTAYDMAENPINHPWLLASALAGTALGASALYFLSKHNKGNSEEFLGRLKDAAGSISRGNAKNWLHTVSDVVETLNGGKPSRSSNFQQALGLGITGLTLLDRFMKSRG